MYNLIALSVKKKAKVKFVRRKSDVDLEGWKTSAMESDKAMFL